MTSNAVQLALGALAAAAVGVAVVWIVPSLNRAEPEQAVMEVEEATVDVVEPVIAEIVPEEVAPVAPTVGLRIDAEGFATIVGQWDAGADIDILLDGQAIDRVQTDQNGSYAFVTQIEPSPNARILSVVADPEGMAMASLENPLIRPVAVALAQVEPEEELIVGAVVVDDAVKTEVADLLEETELSADNSVEIDEADVVEAAEDVAEDIVAAVEETTPEVTIAEDIEMAGTAAIVDEAVQTPTATALVADEQGVRVVAADGASPQALANVALDSITYDPSGEVLLTGRAAGEGFVQVYVDNQPITTSRISGGDWRTDLPEVDTGVYTLRIDEVDEDGTVVSRIETPFKREEPEAVAAVMAEEVAQEDFKVAVRTVQPGSTLWAIAREQFGEGTMFVAVYEANKDLIRDPDLIYPGQVFRMPDIAE